ncbi:hypothetical protein QFZ81_005193 [Paenibacillus sp. V4I9]|uniref:hypothetical protein n=1 Tax=Paenibacillus sp. V4I9 TaxID=3042308 RepID=UPI00277E15BB|nr:hypothetical protein [Paenibacillus sp. V4I9]MDQ0890105.1 hypothetical protein [Paenibacillus sp. V4I9]
MNPISENFVKKHQTYLSDNPNELENFGSIYEHMLFYLTSILGIDEKQALQCILDLKADISCDLLPYIVKSEII